MDALLGRVLRDPSTGLPNLPYFEMIQDWESRRAQRRNYAVRVLDVQVAGGGERVRQSLSWRLCQALRHSDLIASQGREHYRVLLTSPDAENAERLAERLAQMASEINERNPAEPALEVHVAIKDSEDAAAEAPGEPHGP